MRHLPLSKWGSEQSRGAGVAPSAVEAAAPPPANRGARRSRRCCPLCRQSHSSCSRGPSPGVLPPRRVAAPDAGVNERGGGRMLCAGAAGPMPASQRCSGPARPLEPGERGRGSGAGQARCGGCCWHRRRVRGGAGSSLSPRGAGGRLGRAACSPLAPTPSEASGERRPSCDRGPAASPKGGGAGRVPGKPYTSPAPRGHPGSVPLPTGTPWHARPLCRWQRWAGGVLEQHP